MTNNNITKTPEEKEALNRMKNEVAKDLGIDLNSKNLTAKQAGAVGGIMVKRMIESYENSLNQEYSSKPQENNKAQ